MSYILKNIMIPVTCQYLRFLPQELDNVLDLWKLYNCLDNQEAKKGGVYAESSDRVP